MEQTSEQIPLQEEDLKKAEKTLEDLGAQPNSPEEPMNFASELQNIDSRSKTKEGQLSEKLKAYEDWKAKLDGLRKELGVPPQDEPYPNQKSIDDLQGEIDRLKEEMRITQEGKEMNDVLAILSALPESEINILIATGKTSQGKDITGEGGKKIEPSKLQKLLELARNKAKALTKAGFKKLVNAMNAIGGGMYKTEKKERQP